MYGLPKAIYITEGGQFAMGMALSINWVPGGGACGFGHLKCMVFQVVAVHLVRDLLLFQR